MANLARSSNDEFVTHINALGNVATPINDAHTIQDRLVIADLHWWAGTSCTVSIKKGGDSNRVVVLYPTSSGETSGAILAGTYLFPDDVLLIDLVGPSYKGYQLVLLPWREFYRGN